MLNYEYKCRIFSELSSSKIEFFDFWLILGILSACFITPTNIAQPKHVYKVLKINELRQRGTAVTGRTEPKRGSATLKNFFSLKFQGRVVRM